MKKKSICYSSRVRKRFIVIFRTMKLLSILIFAGSMAVTASTYSQVTKIDLRVENATLTEIFEAIEKNSEFIFVYNANVVNTHVKKSISVKNENIEKVLDILFRGIDVAYRIDDRQVFLYKREDLKRMGRIETNIEDTGDQPGRIEITGMVKDAGGLPLPGVSVIVKGTTIGTVTNADGEFSLRIPADAKTLQFSFVGMQAQEIPVEGKNTFSVVMQESVVGIEEVVAVGYGTMKKSDLTGSVTQVDAEMYKRQPLTQVTEMLTGTVAGFRSTQSTAASGGSSMMVRGPNSINASNTPLVVLDGVIYNGDISDINPADIVTIDVLKDASSAAVFGAKAAAGVILITTSKGDKGSPSINVSMKLGVSEARNKDFLVRDENNFMEYRKNFFRTLYGTQPDYYWFSPNDLPEGVSLEQWRSASSNPNPDDTREWLARMNFFPGEVQNYLDGNSVYWANEVMPKGIRKDFDVSVSGGTENATYYWSIGYIDNEGIIKGDKFSALRSRLNNEYKINEWLKVGVNLQYAFRDESTVTANLGEAGVQSPYSKVFNDDGTVNWYPYGYEVSRNPLLNTYGQDRLRKVQGLFAVLYSELTLPYGFSYRFSYQPNVQNIKDYNYWSPDTYVGSVSYANGRIERTDYSNYEWMIDNLIKWNKTFDKHSFDLTLLFNAEMNSDWESMMANSNIQPEPVLGYHGIQFGIYPAVESDDSKVTGDALMARLNYTLNEKYLFTGSIRRDGYSAFGQKYPRATFPAAAFAWQISRENFFNEDWFINRAKLRISWGRNGNRSIGAYSALSALSLNQYYDGSLVQMGVNTSRLANNNLRWEETESLNIGIDMGLFDNRFDLSLDVYSMSTTDLLVERSLPKITGFENITTNIGQLENKGFELTLVSKNINTSNFTWKSIFTYAMNRNKVAELFGDKGEYVLEGKTQEGEMPDITNKWFPGKALDVIWDYDIIGIWQLGEEEEASKYNLKPGDFKAKNLDDVEKYEALQDKTFIGYKEPRHSMGLMNEFTLFKNISASVFLRADLGHLREFAYSVRGWSMFDRQNSNNYPYWTFENKSNEYPRLNNNLASFGGGIMPYKPTSFFRVQDISVSYNLVNTISKIKYLKSCDIFLSARNILTITNWPGWDPESGNDPMPRIYSVGINFTL
ncbi:SusC/RagA family TonB-linked outer membrane protein [Mariniphaga sediminis]|uniref:SusC/RagA family TonB-linked outer membrane protein n=1 Tax=Mariniphaga sediminis TaxID=1628158 RepID=A0A399D030_9BACT|nr:SusC/RagA family TonB-linked outer membrane protein [Mariniphaga sediminis]RIH63700.1 SusC/RagA family TonB-linked outer membrane protein [Mariniphaga sediminis]